MSGHVSPEQAVTFKRNGRSRWAGICNHEIQFIKTIDSNALTPDPLPQILAGNEENVLALVDEFDAVEKLRNQSIDSEKKIKPVFHAMLSLKPGESLTSDQWQTAVRTYMTDLGFTDTNLYVAVMHKDKDHEHVHIVANRIRFDETFSMQKDSNERIKSCLLYTSPSPRD